MLVHLLVAHAAPTDTEFIGGWTKGEERARIERKGERLTLTLLQGGDAHHTGTLEGKGGTRTAALDGCGATVRFIGNASITVALDGPECAIELAGTYRSDGYRPPPAYATMAWNELLASGCDTEKARIRTPFEARVIRNAPFAQVGYRFKNEALAAFFRAEGHTPTGAAGLTDPKQKACVAKLQSLEKTLSATVPMSKELQDRMLWDSENFRVFRMWSSNEDNPYGHTSETRSGETLHWGASYPGCTPEDDCGGYTVTCEDARTCMPVAAG